MSRRIPRLLLALTLVLAVSPLGAAIGTVAPAFSPTTIITLNPATHDGNVGWYLSSPSVSFTADQDGTVHYAWNGDTESTVTVSAGVPTFVDPAPEGVGMLSAYSVNSLEETETPAVSQLVLVDSIPPTRPAALAVDLDESGSPQLNWNASTDGGSGLDGYTVYRNLSGPPFQLSDAIGTTDTEEYTDLTAPMVEVYYAVEARDEAGHRSLLSDAVGMAADRDAPSTPADVEAWINAQGWARVSWIASVDIGSGVGGYEVSRRIDSGEWSVVATMPTIAAYFDDHGDAVSTAGTVEYRVLAFDRSGLQSDPSDPVIAGTDTTPPGAPPVPMVQATHTGELSGSYLVSWQVPDDGLSGVMSGELLWGSVADELLLSEDVLGSSATFDVATTPTVRYFAVRFQDRAGNLSDLSPVAQGRNVAVVRAAGATRIDTAVALSAGAFDSAATAVFASASDYPDALAAAGLAGAVDGPVLLVGPGDLPASTVDELQRLGVTDAYIVGGPLAVSAETEASIAGSLSGATARVSGMNRYLTATAVAETVTSLAGASSRAYIVSATGFADALAVGPAAFAQKVPVLFANATEVPETTLAALAELGVTETIVVGGELAVSDDAEDVLPDPTRISGSTRYETATLFAGWAIAEHILMPIRPVIATGAAFPDGLCAASAAGHAASPVYLVSDASVADVAEALGAQRTQIERCSVAGGPLAVSDATLLTIFADVSVP